MPLSEHEQRLLEQMERALYQEDPKFATTLRSGGPGRASRGRAALGIVAFLVGIALLMTGVIITIPVVGVLGFIAMLAGVYVAWTSLRGGQPTSEAEQQATATTPGGKSGPVKPSAKKAGARGSRGSGGFMSRMEERWQRRRDQGGM